MLSKSTKLRFGDRVQICSGFYEGQTAILTYLCPESACYCGYIEGDGTDQLHYFYGEELQVLERGYYIASEEPYDSEEEIRAEEADFSDESPINGQNRLKVLSKPQTLRELGRT